MSVKDLQILADEDAAALVTALAETRGAEGFLESEAVRLLNWAEVVMREHTMLSLILNGNVSVDVRREDGVLVFRARQSGPTLIPMTRGGR